MELLIFLLFVWPLLGLYLLCELVVGCVWAARCLRRIGVQAQQALHQRVSQWGDPVKHMLYRGSRDEVSRG